MNTRKHLVDDKKGVNLSSQRFRMLEDIAKELAGTVVFPTYTKAMSRLHRTLGDRAASKELICSLIAAEPLVCSKVLGLANAAPAGAGGTQITGVGAAVDKLGWDLVRSTASDVVAKQLSLPRGIADFDESTRQLWEHSILTACACHVIAKHLTALDPDAAFLSGLVHDIGIYYMLYRASQYEELKERPDTVRHLMVQWHESIGETVLNALGLPAEIVLAIRDHDQPRPMPERPATLADIVYVGNILAGGVLEWLFKDLDPADHKRSELGGQYLELLPEIKKEAGRVLAAFAR